jgi:hypothetical protein
MSLTSAVSSNACLHEFDDDSRVLDLGFIAVENSDAHHKTEHEKNTKKRRYSLKGKLFTAAEGSLKVQRKATAAKGNAGFGQRCHFGESARRTGAQAMYPELPETGPDVKQIHKIAYCVGPGL